MSARPSRILGLRRLREPVTLTKPSTRRGARKRGYAYCSPECREVGTRAKISAANTGRVPWNKGKACTTETKAKISAANTRPLRHGHTHGSGVSPTYTTWQSMWALHEP